MITKDVSVYDPSQDRMARLVQINLTATEAAQIEDGINRKWIQGASTFARGSEPENLQALTTALSSHKSIV